MHFLPFDKPRLSSICRLANWAIGSTSRARTAALSLGSAETLTAAARAMMLRMVNFIVSREIVW